MDQQISERVIAFRREVHQYPQTSMHQFQTQKRVKNILKQFGVNDESIKELQPTALIVDLKGKGEAKGNNYCVAFRADMDALSMVEENVDLQYRSKNHGAAHMCGHDGHMACLIGFVPLFLKELEKIPSNKTLRLLFQPSEQGPVSGAKLMIEQGCLQGVDEVYGFHNWPIGKFGDLWCKQGPVMSRITVIKIKITGTGGHGSEPQGLKVAIWRAMDFYQKFKQYIQELKKKTGKFFVCTLPIFQSGERYNVISESVRIEGTLRTFDDDICDQVQKELRCLLEEVKADGFTYELEFSSHAMTANSKKEADNVLRVAREFLGEDKVGSGSLPFRASQDFGEYTLIKPGAFFFFCTKKEEKQVFLHNPRFNFKDELIETASNFWLRLALDRLLNQ